VGLREVWENAGLEVLECLLEAEAGGGERGESGWGGEVGGYGEGVG